MINFRFHLVSLIAVFLALALGVVVGSTVIDRAIVDGLEARIDVVERNAEEVRSENDELRERLGELDDFVEQVAPYAIDEHLDGESVVVLAVRGIDEDAVRSVVGTLRQAGAEAPAILWLEPSWALVEDDRRSALAEILEIAPSRDLLRETAARLLARRIVDGGPDAPVEGVDGDGTADPDDAGEPDGTSGDAGFGEAEDAEGTEGTGEQAGGQAESETTTSTEATETTEAAGEQPEAETGSTTLPEVEGDVLARLDEAGFLAVDRAGAEEFDLGAYPRPGSTAVIVDGPGAQVSAQSLFLPVAEAVAELRLPAVAAEIPGSDDDAEAAAVVGLVRGDERLADRISTVDRAHTTQGRTAVVLALEQITRGQAGHYGTGPGASRLLPEIPGEV